MITFDNGRQAVLVCTYYDLGEEVHIVSSEEELYQRLSTWDRAEDLRAGRPLSENLPELMQTGVYQINSTTRLSLRQITPQSPVPGEEPYFILSVKHTRAPANQNRAACKWWGPDGCGYTWNLHQAGLYTEAEARQVERATERDNLAVRCSTAWKMASTHVSDELIALELQEREAAE